MSYSETFLGGISVVIPEISETEIKKFDTNGLSILDYYLEYTNYSTLHNPFRKFPYYTACNIKGDLFKDIKRDTLFSGKGDTWSKDDRIPLDEQFGSELYGADKSDFDKGHLTKREDVQWGESEKVAQKAAESTFFFTNAIPQVDRLNRGVWRSIENYILHQEVVKKNVSITMFTGPVFLENDPDFVTEVQEKVVKLPYLFWKVIYYLREEKLHRTGFLVSQKRLLEKRRIVQPDMRGDEEMMESLFMSFKEAETYQVRVDFIESIGCLKFQEALEVFIDNTAEQLILSGIDIRSDALNDWTT